MMPSYPQLKIESDLRSRVSSKEHEGSILGDLKLTARLAEHILRSHCRYECGGEGAHVHAMMHLSRKWAF